MNSRLLTVGFVLFAALAAIWIWRASAPNLHSLPPIGPDPQLDLSTAIPQMIRLLTVGDAEGFIQKYMAPADIGRVLTKDRATLTRQTADKKDIIIAALRSIQDTTPTFDSTSDIATFWPAVDPTGKPNQPGGFSMTFCRIGGKWYLQQKNQ
jgi:hypothetical protein